MLAAGGVIPAHRLDVPPLKRRPDRVRDSSPRPKRAAAAPGDPYQQAYGYSAQEYNQGPMDYDYPEGEFSSSEEDSVMSPDGAGEDLDMVVDPVGGGS